MRRLLFILVFLFSTLLFAPNPTSFKGPDGASYRVIREVGHGTYATVYEVERIKAGEPNKTMALRITDGRPAEPKEAERLLYDGIASGNVPHLLPLTHRQGFTEVTPGSAPGQSSEQPVSGQVMPLAAGHLRSDAFTARFAALRDSDATPEQTVKALHEAAALSRQTSTALGELFSLGLVHTDFKSENILYVDQPGKVPPYLLLLTDFDGVETRGATPERATLTPQFTPPEVMSGMDNGPQQTSEARDIYAWAGVTYESLFGHPPITDYLLHGTLLGRANVMDIGRALHNPEELAKMRAFAEKRFDELARRVGHDQAAKAELEKMRKLVMAGLIDDPRERMMQVALADHQSPLVQNLHLDRIAGGTCRDYRGLGSR